MGRRDSIYLAEPRPTAEYEMLAGSGAKWMGMRDAGISFRPPSSGKVPAGYVRHYPTGISFAPRNRCQSSAATSGLLSSVANYLGVYADVLDFDACVTSYR